LAYWVNTIASDHVASHTVGAVQQHFNVGAAKRMPIRLPSIEEQDAILAILGALDDKIEVNRKASATLEAMARALYRSWFVDFDPVWAKLENRPPAHMPPQTAALFPDSFDDDGLPVGWRFGTLADLIEFNPRERIVKGTVAPYFDMRAVPTSGMIADPPIQREFSSGTKFRSMDTLLARITPCLENGKTAMVPMMGEQEVAWGSTEFIVMRPRSGVPASLPYCVARDTAFRDEAIATMTGSSGRQRADAISISELPAAIAGVEVLSEFGDATMPLIDRIHAMGCENQTLATLRDSLLPRLMSGEIRVGDAQNLLKETI
jgi:type I restriction enzyme S subunit